MRPSGTRHRSVSALAVVRLFVLFVGRHGFAGFAWCRIALGLALLACYAR